MLYQQVSILLDGSTWVKVWMPDHNLVECRTLDFEHSARISRDHVSMIVYLGEFQEWDEG